MEIILYDLCFPNEEQKENSGDLMCEAPRNKLRGMRSLFSSKKKNRGGQYRCIPATLHKCRLRDTSCFNCLTADFKDFFPLIPPASIELTNLAKSMDITLYGLRIISHGKLAIIIQKIRKVADPVPQRNEGSHSAVH